MPRARVIPTAITLVLALVLALVPALVPAATAPPTWDWPLPAPHAIVRPFIAPPSPYAAGHRGMDIDASGEPAVSPTDGVVHFAGFVVDRPVLTLDVGGGVLVSFEPLETPLVAGESVRRGAAIGTVIPGHCERPCLHVGVRVDGEYVSPLLYLGGLTRSVLLPTRAMP